MKNHFYFEVMRRTIIQFLDIFNDLRIARYDLETGRLLKYVSVPMKFAPKMKYWWWNDKMDSNGKKIRDIILPHIGIAMTNIELATDRLVNKHAKIRKERHLEEFDHEKFKNPVPYNYTFEVMIASQYMVDATQILEQILPFFDPTAFIRVTIPELFVDHKSADDEEGAYPMDLKVVYEGASVEQSIDMAEEDYRTLIWTLTFKVEGYLFKPSFNDPVIKHSIFEYYNREMGDWPDEPQVVTTSTGISAEKWPIPTLSGDLSGALYDDSIKLFYKYEREGD